MYQYTDSQLPDLLEMECSDMELKNRTLSNFAELVRTGECKKFRGRLKVGVDLGTANTGRIGELETSMRFEDFLTLC